MKQNIKSAIILGLITLVAGRSLGLVYEITKEPIAQVNYEAKLRAWQAVFPEADLDSFESVDVDTSVSDSVAESLNEKVSVNEVCKVDGFGYVITVTDKEGYGGDIKITVGILDDGTVNGISILSINETAGLGMRAKEPSFYEQYASKNTESFYVSKDGGEGEPIDALSGATITSRAVTGAVNEALGYFANAF